MPVLGILGCLGSSLLSFFFCYNYFCSFAIISFKCSWECSTANLFCDTIWLPKQFAKQLVHSFWGTIAAKLSNLTQQGDPGRVICSSRILRKTLQLKKRRDLKNLAKHEKQLNSFSPLKKLCHKARKYMDSINLMLSSMLCVMLVSDILFPLVT